MKRLQRAVSLALTAWMVVSGMMGASAWADAMLVSRLGYPTHAPTRVYLDITTPEARKAARKAEKELARANKTDPPKAFFMRVITGDVFSSGRTAKPPASTEAASSETPGAAATDTKDRDKLEKSVPPDTSGLSQEAREAARLESRKLAEIARFQRQQAIRKRIEEARQRVPVQGEFFLYSLKADQVLYQQEGTLHAVEAETAAAPAYVEFKPQNTAGLYDILVRGSGHRTTAPLWVSDAIYWNALQPVLQDLYPSHCPAVNGRYRVLQECSVLPVSTSENVLSPTDSKTQLVQGGWYTQPVQELDGRYDGPIKHTVDIANLSQTLLQIYAINPKSYRYVNFVGEGYGKSPAPDMLDEARWGLQYLLTLQQPDGSFPAGIRAVAMGNKTRYVFLPATSESTARSVMALATGVRSFEETDLSLTVKMMRAAEKGWRHLSAQPGGISPDLTLLAATALVAVSQHAEYTQAQAQAAAALKSLSAEDALLLGKASSDLPIQESAADLQPGQWHAVAPALAALLRQDKTQRDPLAQWVSALYGYEEIPFARDERFEFLPYDPLQWVATKSGEAAERFSARLSTRGVVNQDPKANSAFLKALEEQEQKARNRQKAAYEALTLTVMERARLAYLLAVLNEQTTPEFDPEHPQKQPKPVEFADPPPVGPKGHYPKMI